jgi:methionyl aminopeptidase
MTTIIEKVGWKFDYKFAKHIFNIDENIIDNNHFTLNNNESYNDLYVNYRKSAVLHKCIRDEIKKKLKSGVKYQEIVDLANSLLNLSSDAQLAFPLGISVNNIMMHDTVIDNNDIRQFKTGDVVKIDLGVHIDGDIIDSAFTHIIDEDLENHKLKPLLDASLDAVYSAIAFSGPDARINEISKEIQEVIESYELEDGTKIKSVFGFGGHNISKYRLHGGKLVLCRPHKTQENTKMEEGEIFAIETYATTGSGMTDQLTLDKCSHYSKNLDFEKVMKRAPTVNQVLKWCEVTRHGLPFNKSWIVLDKKKDYRIELSKAIKEGSIIGYPPIVDKNKNAMVSQFEHTIRVKNGGVEIFSLGDDY